MSAIQIHPIPAFADNYLWLVHNSQNAIVIDPGDAAPVQAFLDAHRLTLSAILLTHHHDDHIGGVVKLLSNARPNLPVFGPLSELRSRRIPFITDGKSEGDVIRIDDLGLQLRVIEVPGHTSGHIAYYAAELSALFCGDTLFAGGCGRMFEGTAAQMSASLNKIAALPSDTRIYCAHEYTQSNLRFAVAVEPGNAALQSRVTAVAASREQGLATVPSELAVELATNPFLRCRSPEIINTLLAQHRLSSGDDAVAVFAALRSWKNSF